MKRWAVAALSACLSLLAGCDRETSRQTEITENLEEASGHIDNAADALMKDDNAGALVEVTQARVNIDRASELQSPAEADHDPYESARK